MARQLVSYVDLDAPQNEMKLESGYTATDLQSQSSVQGSPVRSAARTAEVTPASYNTPALQPGNEKQVITEPPLKKMRQDNMHGGVSEV